MRHWRLLAIGIALTAAAFVVEHAIGATAGTLAASVPLLLVAPIVARGTDALQGRFSPSVVGILQSAFGNVAELAITILALRANLPDVVKYAIVGSLLGNAVLLGGICGVLPCIRSGLGLQSLRFDRRLFAGITTLSVIAFMPIALLSTPTAELKTVDREHIELVVGIGFLVLGALFILSELRKPHMPGSAHASDPNQLPLPVGVTYLAVGGIMAALTSEIFVAGFTSTVADIGMPLAFASLVIVPLVGNVAENFVALRYAWRGDGDAAMSVIMHSVVQIALLMTGLLVVISQFLGATPLTMEIDPLLAIALGLSLIVLWMVVSDGEIEPVEGAGLITVYVILGTLIWIENPFVG